jgi:RHS repeat-associated protein
VNGTHYGWHVRTFDGTDYSPWSGWSDFTADTTAPAAPTVTSGTHPGNTWTATTSGDFAWSSTSTDVGSWLYGLDNNAMTGTTGTSATGVALTAGPHTFKVQAKDNAGNLSSVSSYSFSVGSGSLDSPKPDDRTQQWSSLSSSAPSDRNGVTYRYRRGADGNYVDIPAADVSSGGNPVAGWPLNRSGSALPSVVWNVKATLDAAVGGEADDQPVQIIACFTGGAAGCTGTTSIAYTRHTFGDSYATDQVGPGSVSLLTGDYSTSASDVTVPSYNGTLTIGRTSTTFAKPASGAASVFGPGWTADLAGPDAGAADLWLDDHTNPSTGAGYATLTDGDGSVSTYLRTGTGTAYPWTFAGTGDAAADSTTLARTSATTYTLTDGDGTVTTYTSGAGGWQATAVTQPGSNSATSYAYDTNGLVTRILGPIPAGVTCPAAGQALVAGCRALLLEYGTVPGGGTGQRLLRVKYAAGATTPVEVATYSYDSSGRLASVYDPRADVTTGQHLTTTYTYTYDGKLATVTPPGQAAWTITYGTGNQLTSVSRPTPVGTVTQTATETVAYALPLSGSGLPDLTAGQTDRWGQADKPLAGAAVFPADHAPTGAPAAADWPFAKLTYYDVNGRPVNTASYGAGGWQIDATEYNAQGNAIRELTEGNRAHALAEYPTDPVASAERAAELDTQTQYDPNDPTLVTNTWEPAHDVTLDNGTVTAARSHTSTAYDQGAPVTGGPYRLATTVTNGPCVGTNPGSCIDTDQRVTVNGYDQRAGADAATSGWALRQPTAVTTRMGANGAASAADVTRVTYYNADGQAVETRQPREAAAGGGPGTTLTRYYTATDSAGDGKCISADWAGLLCTSGPAAQPTGTPLPVKTVTSYNSLAQPLTTTEDSGSGATIRTTTITYDAAGRSVTSAVTATGSNPGTVLPQVSTTYDPGTGLPRTTSSTAGTITVGYDNLGRTTSYTDATGATTTTSYNIDSRPATFNDGKGTTTYTYDSSTEHRGLVTSLNTGMGGAPSTFTAGYDEDGSMVSQSYPNGIVAASNYDPIGDETSRTYTKGSTTLLDLEQTNSGQGQVRTDTGPLSSKTYTYDPLGRLTSAADVRDVATGGTSTFRCTTRSYGFDNAAGLNSNRTSYTSNPDAGSDPAQPTCSSTTGTAVTHSYDAADRLTDTGYTYDNLGRTLTMPATDAGGTDTSVGYYTNDLVASQTQAGHTRSYSLDPTQQRIASWTDGTTTTNHYNDTTDEPDWTSTVDTTNPNGSRWTRNVEGIDGDLAATQDDTGTVTLQLANLHGDIVGTMPDDPTANALAGTANNDEFGNRDTDAVVYATYGWLGAKQRSSNTLPGSVLMGVRLYQPQTGRFLSIDPVAGGSCSRYDYVCADPGNGQDLDGRFSLFGGTHWAERLVCIRHPYSCYIAKKAATLSLKVTDGLYGGHNGNGLADAFQHIFWAATMTALLGPVRAMEFLTAHETWRGNPARERNMDMGNNALGVGVGLAAGSNFWHLLSVSRLTANRVGRRLCGPRAIC